MGFGESAVLIMNLHVLCLGVQRPLRKPDSRPLLWAQPSTFALHDHGVVRTIAASNIAKARERALSLLTAAHPAKRERPARAFLSRPR